jgi:hypothetical protein
MKAEQVLLAAVAILAASIVNRMVGLDRMLAAA